jgi:hypothetical protein
MIEFLRRWLGKDAEKVGPPTGKTGNQLTTDDFAESSSELAIKGGTEFADFCISQGSCEIQGAVLEKFKAVLVTYPIADEEEYDHFAVVVRDRLIAHGLLAKGDPQRYQYKIAQWAPLMAAHAE